MNKNSVPLIIVIVVVIIFTGFIWYKNATEKNVGGMITDGESVMCTMDAKICPDGSYVGRTGPQCEFAECPGEDGDPYWIEACKDGGCPDIAPFTGELSTWKRGVDTTKEVLFSYPEKIKTTYIHTTKWPPVVTLLDTPYSCTAKGTETSARGKTEEQTIAGEQYCVNTQSETAAGSVYLNYIYTSVYGDKTVRFVFGLRQPQCENYNVPEQAACEKEREKFNIGMIFYAMMASVEPSQ
ncbi:MAG TPA: hypothetical protein PK295_03180 [Candidatus Magasanikbacteria bacterium]|nr:hypothetical protein [Candidatus Magasanikbacteria bacterium]